MKQNKLIKIISIIIIIPTLAVAGFIMYNHLGLVDSLDFGAGAYYYADIPNFEKFVNSGAYTSPVPMWIIIALFLLWGFIIYKFWVWADRK
ncbi:MAG: hypothetical protein IJ608_11605 [Lachnospiraceae bacterium]|nr:hypothetical protein [Lachnospiraceae bacterium]